MKRQTFAWDRSSHLLQQRDRWFERLWIVALLLAALLLFGLNLGGVPLSEGSESAIAQVAREMARAPAESWPWLFPTLYGEPYFASAPLVPNLMAVSYAHLADWTWAIRLPGALLAALSVPLLYGLGRELFPIRLPALFAALFYLTFFPVMRQGRLAGPGGAILCLMMLAIWCALRSRRDWRWTLGLGISLGLLGLTHSGAALLVGAIALGFLAWDTPRLMVAPFLWLGLALGLAPAIAWYGLQSWYYGEVFWSQAIAAPLLAIVQPERAATQSLLLLAAELTSLAPSLLFCASGLALLWPQRHWGWAKLTGLWGLGGSVAIAASLLNFHPNLLLVLYPGLALAGGAQLAELWQQPRAQSYPLNWAWSLLGLGLAATAACLLLSSLEPHPAPMLVLASVALTLGIAAMLLARQDVQFVTVLFWGVYVSLLLLASSPYWLWSQRGAAAVEPVAAILRYATPPEQPVYASLPAESSALNFYSDRRVLPATTSELQRYWNTATEPYLLLDAATLVALQLPDQRLVARADPDWTLVTKQRHSARAGT